MPTPQQLDDAFATQLTKLGMATKEEVKKARGVQAGANQGGESITLADALIQTGIITEATKQKVLKQLDDRKKGGTKKFGQYTLIKKLGEGAMGAVFLAEDGMLQRKVAIKILPKRHAENAQFLARFQREAKAAGNLNHANICGAFAVGEEQGLHYYAMEYCEGESLGDKLKREKQLPEEEVIRIALQAAEGLKYAHEHSFVHRDIKPDNLFLLNNGFVKILDLGLTKDVGDDDAHLTQAGSAVGTPHYISPEQARGEEKIDGRADIYSLGATLYRLLTGETPFQGPNSAAIFMKHVTEEPRSPKVVNPGLSDGITNVVQRMMAKQPDARHEDCSALIEDLKLVQQGGTPAGPPRTGQTTAIPRLPGRRTTGPRDAVRGRNARRTGARSPVGTREASENGTAGTPDNRKHFLILGAGLAIAMAFGVVLLLNKDDAKPKPKRTARKKPDEKKPEPAKKKEPKPEVNVAEKTEPPKTEAPASEPKAPEPNKLLEGLEAKYLELQAWEKANPNAFDEAARRYNAFQTEANGKLLGGRFADRVKVALQAIEARRPPAPVAKTDPPTQEVTQTGEWINLLPLIDPGKHRVSGPWSKTPNGELVVVPGRTCRIRIPFEPPEEYDFAIEFTRHSGSVVTQFLSRAGKNVMSYMGGRNNKTAGIHCLGGNLRPNNGTEASCPLQNHRRYRSEVRVRKDVVESYLDGKLITKCTPQHGAWSLHPVWSMPNPRELGLGSNMSRIVFHVVQLKAVKSGEIAGIKPEPGSKAPGFEKDLEKCLVAFDAAVAKDDLKQAAQIVEKAKADPKLKTAGKQVEALAGVSTAIAKATDKKKKALEALLDGKKRVFKTTKGTMTGVVRKIEGDAIRVRVQGKINNQVIEYEKRVKLSDLTPACRAELLGDFKPTTPDEWIAQTLLKIIGGETGAAEQALQSAGPHPLVAHYRRGVDALKAKALEGDAEQCWEKKIKPLLAVQKFNKANAKPAMETIDAFNKDYGRTHFATTKQEEWKALKERVQTALGASPRLTLNLGGGVTMKFALIPPGTFLMGDPPDYKGMQASRSAPQHRVTLTRPYYMATTPVTVGQFKRFVAVTGFVTLAEKQGRALTFQKTWQQVAGANWRTPGFQQTDSHPVVAISYNGAKAFCKWLSNLTGKSARLPTEAEWEHACRAGTQTRFWSGDTDEDLRKVAWCSFDGNRGSGGGSRPTGQFKPNAYGLHDIHGQVWEWTQNWFAAYPNTPVTDPASAPTGKHRVVRGGSWGHLPDQCRSGYRGMGSTYIANSTFGLRVTLDPPKAEEKEAQPLDARKLKARLFDRYTAFVKHFMANDINACEKMVSPEERKTTGSIGVQTHLRIARGFATAAQLTKDRVRIKDIKLGPDGKTAEVIQQFNIGNTWRDQDPSKWVFVDGEWYAKLK